MGDARMHGRIRKCPASLLPKVEKLNRFGAHYCIGEDEELTRIKDESWQHIKEKTGGDLSETEETYMTAIGGRVERNARKAYAESGALENMEGGDFKRCMIKHGCLFLLAVLALLGAESHHLRYSNNEFIWGSNLTSDDLERKMKLFYKSMLFPGNQLPLAVLNQLMEQTFFKEVVAAKGRWDRPSDDLVLCVLFDLILLPCLQNAYIREQPIDILHCLHQRSVGIRRRRIGIRGIFLGCFWRSSVQVMFESLQLQERDFNAYLQLDDHNEYSTQEHLPPNSQKLGIAQCFQRRWWCNKSSDDPVVLLR